VEEGDLLETVAQKYPCEVLERFLIWNLEQDQVLGRATVSNHVGDEGMT
jgi:hypothetical protein